MTTALRSQRRVALAGLGDYWGLLLGYGVVCLALGVVLAIWPGETLQVCAVLLAVQLLVGGVVRVAMSLSAGSLDAVARVLLGITGGLAFVVGLLCLRDPLQTLLAIGLMVGAWWLVSGVADIVSAVLAAEPARRSWDLFAGIVSVLAGAFLLVHPDLSLGLLVLVTCFWLFSAGALAVVAALRTRALRHRAGLSDPGSEQTLLPGAP